MKSLDLISKMTQVSLTLALTAAAAQSAHAMGAAPAAAQAVITNKSEFLETAIRTFNAKHAEYIGEELREMNGDGACRYVLGLAPVISWSDSIQLNAEKEFCAEINQVIPPGRTCSEIIRVQIGLSGRYRYYSGAYDGCTPYLHLTASLTSFGQTLAASSFFYDPSNSSVEYSVNSIQAALQTLDLLPRQRKSLEGFSSATEAFVKKMETEKAKGTEALPLMHRSFSAQAHLLVAYYRYLKEEIAEFAQLSSGARGVAANNRDAVGIIEKCIQKISTAYGIDSDVGSKQVADYGRVFMDLLTNLSAQMTATENQTYLRPLLVQIASKVVPTSEAFGDIGTKESVTEFGRLWEQESFQNFLKDKLSATDERINTLILNLSNLAYKIGLSANVDIRTFDEREIERIRAGKNR